VTRLRTRLAQWLAPEPAATSPVAGTAELELARTETLERLARAAEFRDDDTGRHVVRVGRYARLIAEEIGWTGDQLDALSSDFDAAEVKYAEQAASAGYDLSTIGERDTIRVLPKYAPAFMAIAFNERLAQLLSRMLGGYYILNQVNGLINRANSSKYAQAAFHRDIPYQHFVSSRPLAINALFALGAGPRAALRARLAELLHADGSERRQVEGMKPLLLTRAYPYFMAIPLL